MALRFAPQDPEIAASYRRGVDFVASLVTESGQVRNGLEGPRYPTYSIASAILLLNAAGNERHRTARDVLIADLRRRQLSAKNGWKAGDPSRGGWSYYHGIPRKKVPPEATLTANLSATLFAIGALRLAGVPPEDPALIEARHFVRRCQNFAELGAGSHDDGGFFFAPELPDGNKAGVSGRDPTGRVRYRSYGSMTADGLRALMRLGAVDDYPRIRAAAGWLEAHYLPDRNPGRFDDRDEVRRRSSHYYYAWTSSHALRALGKVELATKAGRLEWPRALAESLIAQQRPDGSWSNRYTEMREDDPLLATSFAAAALAVAATALASQYRSHGAVSISDRDGQP